MRKDTSCTLNELIWYFTKLGATGFGGPIALVGHMQRDLVEDRGWISKGDFHEGLTLSQLAPGPLAAQLAIYIGWLKAGARGAALTGIAFVLPSFLMVMVLAAAYLKFGGLPWIRGVFYGVGAAVIAMSAYKLVRRTFERDVFLWIIGGISASITMWTESEELWIFLAAGVSTVVVRKWIACE